MGKDMSHAKWGRAGDGGDSDVGAGDRAAGVEESSFFIILILCAFFATSRSGVDPRLTVACVMAANTPLYLETLVRQTKNTITMPTRAVRTTPRRMDPRDSSYVLFSATSASVCCLWHVILIYLGIATRLANREPESLTREPKAKTEADGEISYYSRTSWY